METIEDISDGSDVFDDETTNDFQKQSDQTKSIKPKLYSSEESPEIVGLQDNKMLHLSSLCSSSPDLLQNEEKTSRFGESGEGVAGEMLISQRELDVCDDFIGQQFLKSHQQQPIIANGSIAGANSFLHTSMRVITQSKSCNNILLDNVDGNKKKKKKKKSIRMRTTDHAISRPVPDEPVCDVLSQMDHNGLVHLKQNKKHRTEKLECCSVS